MRNVRVRFLLLLSLWFIRLGALPLFAAEPPAEPILRIEAGAHTAMINRVATDAAGRLAVTAADDKSARLYEVASGRLLRTFRPPVGEGNEGKLFAVALSPDGGTVAAGGWTKLGSDTGHTIYLFDAHSGRLQRRIAGLPNVINHLAFSADGRQLAASLGGKNGFRVFNTSDGSEAGRDADYGGSSYSVHFAADGRLVSTSLDGFVRLYDRSLRLLAKEKAPGGSRPYTARFSPDGARIAVGYADSTKVDVLAGETLIPLFAADTAGVGNGSLFAVAWSADGRTLYAGGMFATGGQRPIRRWRDGGRGKGEDLPVGAADTLMDLVPLPDGSLLFGAADPALGVLERAGQARLLAGPPVADYRSDYKGYLRLSADGGVVRFWYRDEQSYARFATASRELLPGADDESSLAPPRAAAPGLQVTGWGNTYEPKLNGAPLQLDQYERSRSLGIAPDGESFVLGTNWSLRRFSKQGKELWQRPVPGIVWGVNIPANGGMVVAAYADGTIRWHRLTDGEELLAFFPHADRKRWVVWTPSGYFDASPGGEELIGWHVNHGKDREADFFSASKFRATYYRPDIVSRVLTTMNEATAVAQANAAAGRREAVAITQVLPPVVSIVNPVDGGTFAAAEVPVRFSLRTPEGSPVTNVRVLVDGRPVSQTRGIDLKAKTLAKGEEEREVVATLPPRDCEVTVIAENANASSVPATIRLRWAGQAPKAEEFSIQPKLYVLSVGVSDYADPSLKLGLAAKDARDFAAALTGQKGLLYRDVVAKVLTDATATKDDILDGLEWLRKETTSKDVAVLFIAGHGVNDPSGLYYYLPQNANTERLMRTGVAFSDIKNTIASLAGKTLFFVDTCHSGNVMGARRGTADINAVVNELSSAENGAVVFASSTGRQYSLEKAEWGNGAFTKALVEGLGGKADYTGKGKITINMLDLYLSERVKELTGGQQTPTTTKPQTIQDFPIAVKR